MKTNIQTPSLSSGYCHTAFQEYLSGNIDNLQAFHKGIAIHAVGRAIALAATGAQITSIVMPTMCETPRCAVTFTSRPESHYGQLLHILYEYPEQFLEDICCQISGAVSGYLLDDGDYYGELGLEDIEDATANLKIFETVHRLNQHHVLAGCSVVAERVLGRNLDLAEEMVQRLLEQGNLDHHDMRRYLSIVAKENIGKQVLAATQEPWIKHETERVQRLFIGSD